jgi:5-methyltetrahydrofolate--homocysteine methyltransferase
LACPDLAQNKIIYDLLGLEQYGISISQTYQFDPEQSTCAVIVPHSKAKYFNV